jgi:hypothetical protein
MGIQLPPECKAAVPFGSLEYGTWFIKVCGLVESKVMIFEKTNGNRYRTASRHMEPSLGVNLTLPDNEQVIPLYKPVTLQIA